jgi:hypothetical protein
MEVGDAFVVLSAELSALRFEDFGGGDDLADVALGVVGYVDERTADGGG